MKFEILHALSVLAQAINKALAQLEMRAYNVANNAMHRAHDEGIAAEQRIVNAAKAELDAARRKLEDANTTAQAVLKAYPQRIEALRQKVFG